MADKTVELLRLGISFWREARLVVMGVPDSVLDAERRIQAERVKQVPADEQSLRELQIVMQSIVFMDLIRNSDRVVEMQEAARRLFELHQIDVIDVFVWRERQTRRQHVRV